MDDISNEMSNDVIYFLDSKLWCDFKNSVNRKDVLEGFIEDINLGKISIDMLLLKYKPIYFVKLFKIKPNLYFFRLLVRYSCMNNCFATCILINLFLSDCNLFDDSCYAEELYKTTDVDHIIGILLGLYIEKKSDRVFNVISKIDSEKIMRFIFISESCEKYFGESYMREQFALFLISYYKKNNIFDALSSIVKELFNRFQNQKLSYLSWERKISLILDFIEYASGGNGKDYTAYFTLFFEEKPTEEFKYLLIKRWGDDGYYTPLQASIEPFNSCLSIFLNPSHVSYIAKEDILLISRYYSDYKTIPSDLIDTIRNNRNIMNSMVEMLENKDVYLLYDKVCLSECCRLDETHYKRVISRNPDCIYKIFSYFVLADDERIVDSMEDFDKNILKTLNLEVLELIKKDIISKMNCVEDDLTLHLMILSRLDFSRCIKECFFDKPLNVEIVLLTTFYNAIVKSSDNFVLELDKQTPRVVYFNRELFQRLIWRIKRGDINSFNSNELAVIFSKDKFDLELLIKWEIESGLESDSFKRFNIGPDNEDTYNAFNIVLRNCNIDKYDSEKLVNMLDTSKMEESRLVMPTRPNIEILFRTKFCWSFKALTNNYVVALLKQRKINDTIVRGLIRFNTPDKVKSNFSTFPHALSILVMHSDSLPRPLNDDIKLCLSLLNEHGEAPNEIKKNVLYALVSILEKKDRDLLAYSLSKKSNSIAQVCFIFSIQRQRLEIAESILRSFPDVASVLEKPISYESYFFNKGSWPEHVKVFNEFKSMRRTINNRNTSRLSV